MSVKIDIDMPKRCAVCRFKTSFLDENTWCTRYSCDLAFKKIDIKKRKRPDFCPLKECK